MTVLAPSVAHRVWNWTVSLVFLAIIVAEVWAVVELLVLPHHRESPASRSPRYGSKLRGKKRDKAA